MNHRVRHRTLTTNTRLPPIQQTHPLTIAHLSPISGTQHLERPLKGIHRLRNRTHVRNTTAGVRHEQPRRTNVGMNPGLGITPAGSSGVGNPHAHRQRLLSPVGPGQVTPGAHVFEQDGVTGTDDAF